MAKFMQIIDVNQTGTETVLHPETDADFVIPGSTYRVPKMVDITDWNNKSKEIIDARKGLNSLVDKINLIDNALLADNILRALKTVDGTGSGLDADLIDGKSVNDNAIDINSLWTSSRIKEEINKMVSKDDLVSSPVAYKVLKMDKDGFLPTSITGNAASATRLKNPITLNFEGGAKGTVNLIGNGETQEVNLQIVDNSHLHNKLEGDVVFSNVKDTSSNVFEFKANNLTKSYIDSQGNFSGGADNVGGYKVDNYDEQSLWTGEKVQEAIETELQSYAQKIGDNVVAVGPITYMHGEVSLTGLNTVVINPPQPINEKIISESYVISSSDKTMTFVKDPLSDNSSIRINFNKLGPVDAKLSWYITSI